MTTEVTGHRDQLNVASREAEVTPVVLVEQQTASERAVAVRAADIAESLTLVRRYLGQSSRHGANRAEADRRMAFRLECQIEKLQALAADLAAADPAAPAAGPQPVPADGTA